MLLALLPAAAMMPSLGSRNNVSQSHLSALASDTKSSEDASIEDDSNTYAGSVHKDEVESSELPSPLQRLSSHKVSPHFHMDVGV